MKSNACRPGFRAGAGSKLAGHDIIEHGVTTWALGQALEELLNVYMLPARAMSEKSPWKKGLFLHDTMMQLPNLLGKSSLASALRVLLG